MLGWDVGTFEFLSESITAEGFTSLAKLKMRTGGSTGHIGKTHCHKTENGGLAWSMGQGKPMPRLPVKFRYRSPVVFELHVAGKRSAAAYAVIWLQHLIDNNATELDLPIWTTKMGPRLTQNYGEARL